MEEGEPENKESEEDSKKKLTGRQAGYFAVGIWGLVAKMAGTARPTWLVINSKLKIRDS